MMDIGATLGQYHITAAVGAGGMGEVYRATDTGLGREVALKMLPEDFADDPDRHARFEREARLLASINHPNIATLYGLEHLDGKHVLVMELVDGEALDQIIAGGPIAWIDAIPIALQITKALEAAHEHGIVHRDLKPANVMVRVDGTVKVLDFGLAKSWESDGSDSSLSMSPTLTAHATAAGVILGTAAYMAPEQAAGTAADRRADIWSFGVVLWEMLVGQRLFDGETVSHVLASVLKDEIDVDALPKETPAPLRELIGRCLRRKPKQRLQAIGDARVALEEFVADPSVWQTREDATTADSGRRVRWWSAPVALALLLGGAAAGYLAAPSDPGTRRVVRFTLDAPPDTSYHLDPVGPGPVAVSPDGSSLVFTARDPDGTPTLYVRALDTFEARRLPGTEGAQYPFWSPDSRSVGFFAEGKLKKIEIDGGPAISLANAGNGKGGSWSPKGVIVFSPSHNTPLSIVPSAGGEPRALTAFDEDRGDNSHRHPRFLPDGKHFLYLARGTGTSDASGHVVVVGSIDDGNEIELMRSTAAADYAAGRLLYARENTLMARPFDAGRLELSGDAVPVCEDVMVINGAAVVVASASGGDVLAYQSGGGWQGGVLTWFDRAGEPQGTIGEQSAYRELWISPDGTMAAVGIDDHTSGMSDIWIIELDRNLASRLTSDPGDEQQIVWSPDSTHVAFARAVDSRIDIYRKLVGGASDAEALYEADLDTFPTSWSPDGRLLAFDAASPDTGWDEWILSIDEGEAYPFLQSKFNETNGVFSPDGRWMAYVSDESGRPEVYVTRFPGPGRRWRVSTDGALYPRWNSNGRELFYQGLDGGIVGVAMDLSEDSVRIGEPRAMIESRPTGLSYPYSPSPGGERFLLIDSQVGVQPLNVVLDWTAKLEGDAAR